MPVVDRPEALDESLRGLDALELPLTSPTPPWSRTWLALWPKVAAIGVGLIIWQLIVASGFRPEYVLPQPSAVFDRLFEMLGSSDFWQAVAITMQRAAIGFAVAVAVGTTLGLILALSERMRTAVGSLITGFQSMPSIVWFPFAILLFGLNEAAIFFVIVLGAAPSIANGFISGVDHIPPVLLRAGTVLGARGPRKWFNVILPAAMPGYIAGLKQGWAFSWRSLMAGELLVIIAERPSIGVRLQFARELSDAASLQAMMIVVLVIGLAVDLLVFGRLEQSIRKSRGLIPQG
jgi:NitT/TauT family transport system permease protein